MYEFARFLHIFSSQIEKAQGKLGLPFGLLQFSLDLSLNYREIQIK
jgi:hypothetical protein